MASKSKKTAKRCETFLQVLSTGKSVTAAAAAIDVDRHNVYDWKKKDPEFAKAWESAIEAGTDVLEDEARRRAQEGYEEPIYYKGEIVGIQKKWSDMLTILLLKARRPEKYREYQSSPEKTQLDELIDAIKKS